MTFATPRKAATDTEVRRMKMRVYRDRGLEKDLVGAIDFEPGSTASFSYDGAYLEKARSNGELGISERLPLSEAPYEAAEMAPFFHGLLPEGEVRDNLAQMYQVPRSDYLSMLWQLGCESIGALTFVSEGVEPDEYEPRYDELTAEVIEAIRANPVRAATLETSATRLSLSGAQSKVAWFLPEGLDPDTAEMKDWLVPRGTAASTHIVKIARKGEEMLAENERGCARLAIACGMAVARVSPLPDLPGAIAVERYDRTFLGAEGSRRAARLHQEDFCQALGFPPYLKYQPESGEGEYLLYIADLIDSASLNPRSDRVEFAKRLVFNYAVGNSDAHLKNSSLLYNAEWTGRRLSPLYDVTCIPLTGYSTKMPFAIGAHRDLSEIDEHDIMSIALDMGVDLDDFDTAVRQVVDGLSSRNPYIGGDLAEAMTRIAENAAPRIAVLERFCQPNGC